MARESSRSGGSSSREKKHKHKSREKSADEAARKSAKAERKAKRADLKASATSSEISPVSEEKSANASSSESKPSIAPSTSSEDIKAFFSKNAVKIDSPKGSLDPYLAMSDVPLSADLAEKLSQFSKPTPIQSATWPYLLAGNDVVGVAETGSGKTLAFGVPACQRILAEHWQGISVLIVSPTRELAMQINDNLKMLNFPVVCIYGGVPKYQQQQDVKKAKIVVGTPGRLRDLIGDGSLPLNRVRYLVLDEADRMLERGFEQDIRDILGSAPPPPQRQTVMFTATWPPQVRDLAASFMSPGGVVRVSIGDADELSANKRITQIVEVVDPRQKERRFLDILRKYTREDPKQKILVFALYKKEATRIEALLQRNGYKVAAIHGDLGQAQRTQALADFKSGHANLMLATDVAARGLDIPAVKVVINLTFPLTVEDYVHRIGRTGRAGQTGIAHTLFTEQEKHLAGALGNVLRGAGQSVPEDLMRFGTHTKKKEHSLYGAFFKDVDTTQKAKKIKFD